MRLADRLFPSFMRAADEAFEAVTAWRQGTYGFPDASIAVREIVFKEGSGPGHKLLELCLQTPDGSMKMFSVDSVGTTECLTAIGTVIARGALSLWAAESAQSAASILAQAVKAGRSYGLDEIGLKDLWNEAVVREVMSS